MATTAKKRTKRGRAKVTLATINRMLEKDLGLDPSDLQMWRDRDRVLYWGGNLTATWNSCCAETLDANSETIEGWRDEAISLLRDNDQLAVVDVKFLPSIHEVACDVENNAQASIADARASIEAAIETLQRLEEYHDDTTTDDLYRAMAKLNVLSDKLQRLEDDAIAVVDVLTCAHNARVGRREDERAGIRMTAGTYD